MDKIMYIGKQISDEILQNMDDEEINEMIEAIEEEIILNNEIEMELRQTQ